MSDDGEKRQAGLNDEEKKRRAHWVMLTRQACSIAEEATGALTVRVSTEKLQRAIILLKEAQIIMKGGKTT